MEKGKVENRLEHEKADKRWLTVTINGQMYGIWDSKLWEKCPQGAIISFEFETKGQYRNITGIVQEGDQQLNNYAKQNKTQPRETTMIRMSALKNAVELMSVMQGAGVLQKEEATMSNAIQKANTFVDWILAEGN